LPILAALDLQTKRGGNEAASTTSEEFVDNLWMIIAQWVRDTHTQPVLSYDNNKIQAAVDVSHLEYAQGQEGKPVIRLNPALNKVDLPTYSPDMNRIIEHVFGDVKQRVRSVIYGAQRDFTKPAVLQDEVKKAFKSLTPGAVKKDVYGLPLLWQILSTAEGATFQDSQGHTHVGTGGDYPPCRYTR
jgi:hypothetical protein